MECDVRLPIRLLILIALAGSWSCSGSTPNAATPNPVAAAVTVASLTVNAAAPLTRANQTVQLTATATFSDGTTQNVTSGAGWQSLAASIATVSADGVVTALTSGSVTITASYRGISASATVTVAIAPPNPNGRSSMSAVIDGVAWNAITVLALKTPLPNNPTGVVAVSGTNAFSGAYIEIAFGVPATVGTHTLGSNSIANAALQIPNNRDQWVSTTAGASGTITLSTLTATGATGTFSLTLVPLPNTTTRGNKVVTNGVFNVTF